MLSSTQCCRSLWRYTLTLCFKTSRSLKLTHSSALSMLQWCGEKNHLKCIRSFSHSKSWKMAHVLTWVVRKFLPCDQLKVLFKTGVFILELLGERVVLPPMKQHGTVVVETAGSKEQSRWKFRQHTTGLRWVQQTGILNLYEVTFSHWSYTCSRVVLPSNYSGLDHQSKSSNIYVL